MFTRKADIGRWLYLILNLVTLPSPLLNIAPSQTGQKKMARKINKYINSVVCPLKE